MNLLVVLVVLVELVVLDDEVELVVDDVPVSIERILWFQ